MRLFDDRTHTVRDLAVTPRMTVYVCGITPYDAAHLGHAFTYTHFDVLVRLLRHAGVDVLHAQNITDVDDDILRVAKERGEDYLELGNREVAGFIEQMRAIGNEPPTFSPRATEFVPQMIEEVRNLLTVGHAYERSGTVYFRIASDPDYGSLSGFTREQMLPLAEERGGHPEDPKKDAPLDFVLWQASVEGEPWWESPWGRGRPGWHIECSTMSRSLLGQPLDIHGGGTDLIYPHHESETAQAECGHPTDTPFVRRWMHTGTVYMAGEKMSKSLGNLTFVRDLLARHDPMAIREFLLRHHYREDWEFDEAALGEQERRRFAHMPLSVNEAPPQRHEFYAALDEDLDTPRALRVLDHARMSHHSDAPTFVKEASALLGLSEVPSAP